MAGRKRADVTATGAPAELAQRLRALRDESHLTLRQLAAKSGFSASTLSLAESGRTVPSWDLIAAFVQSCGQDAGRWRQLWEFAQAQATAPTAGDHEPVTGQVPADRPAPEPAAPVTPVHRRRWPAVLAGGAVLVAAVTIALVVTIPALTGHSDIVAAARDGTDPYIDHCKADERQMDWQPVLRANHTMFGTIVLMYSPACQAAWGYLDGPNSTAWTTHIIARRIPGTAIAPSQFGGNAAYGSWGNVLSTQGGCVYIEAYVTDRGGQGPHAKTACLQPHPPTTP